jgi:hypothetical protein
VLLLGFGGRVMSYWASENYIMNEDDIKWLCRERTILEKIKKFFFGAETLDHHFKR